MNRKSCREMVLWFLASMVVVPGDEEADLTPQRPMLPCMGPPRTSSDSGISEILMH